MPRASRMECPSEDALLRWSSGDLPARRAGAIARHVSGCEACASRLRGWDEVMAACRGEAHGDRGVAQRRDEAAAVARFEARLRREPRASAGYDWLPAPHVRWVHAAAVLLLAVGGMFWLRPAQATLSAEALIAGAVESEQDAPRARSAADSVTIVPIGRTSALASGGAAVAGARELARRLAVYQFDTEAPLSARPFQQWRASTSARADSLEWLEPSLVRVSTSAAAGHVRRAELMLRMPDFRPVAQTWRFADGFEVELRLRDRLTPGGAVSPFASLAAAASGTTNAAGGVAAAVAPRSADETELDLRGALERAGVVLDRRLAIRRAGDLIVIDGRATAAVAARIGAAARDLPRVELRIRNARFSRDARDLPDVRSGRAAPNGAENSAAMAGTGGGAGAVAESVAGGALGNAVGSAVGGIANATSPGLRAWLDRTFAGSRLHDSFLPRTRELDERLRDAVAALDGLAARYPAPAAARLPAASRQQLQRLVHAYFDRVTASYERLEAHLAPLIGTVSRRVLPADAPSTWRQTASVLDADLDCLSDTLAALAREPFDSAEQFEAAARERVRPALAAVAPR